VASLPPDAAAIAKVVVELGSQIAAGILESACVQQALRALLHAAWAANAPDAPTRSAVAPVGVEPTAATRGVPETASLPPPVSANGKLRVLIAGMAKHEAAVLARTYDDTLELVCWSAEDGLEALPDAVGRAAVVVGMASELSQPVEQTLRRHARRYLRNARGVAALRSELVELALSATASAVGEGAAERRT
jgi:hypothetical protein